MRTAAGIIGDEPDEVRQRERCARLGRTVAANYLERVAPLIGEMAGVPLPDRNNDVLRLADFPGLFAAERTPTRPVGPPRHRNWHR